MAHIGVLHPGQMGVSIAASAAAGDNEVLWASQGRSPATSARAADLDLADTVTVAAMAEVADIIVSVCPPASAVAVAEEVAATRFGGIFVDANAVSPATGHQVGATVERAGATAVDGGIVGPPAWGEGSTRLYLAGAAAGSVAAAMNSGLLDVVALDADYGAASALKMAYAGWTKGSSALLLTVAAYARSAGILDDLVSEWNLSQPGVAARVTGSARGTSPKAWRFVGEMDEIAASLSGAGLPDGFHAGAAETYRRMAGFKDAAETVELEEVLEVLLAPGETG